MSEENKAPLLSQGSHNGLAAESRQGFRLQDWQGVSSFLWESSILPGISLK